MTKAYDFQELIEKYKSLGIDQAEVLAAGIYKKTIEWFKESALLSTNPYDDLAVPFTSQLDAVVLPQIDKISGNIHTP